jgi:ribosomal-protein-alanine N-acetyltransferase
MAAARIETMRQLALKGTALPFVVLMKVERELIGWVMINRDAENRRRGSLGYWLGETYQGKGYMKETVPVVLAAGFKLLELDVIDAAAQPENTGSFAVMQACGMKRVREGKVYAPAREREELCFFYEIERPLSSR